MRKCGVGASSLRRTPEKPLRRQAVTAPVPALTARRRLWTTPTQGPFVGCSQRQSAWSEPPGQPLVTPLPLEVCATICGCGCFILPILQTAPQKHQPHHLRLSGQTALIVYFRCRDRYEARCDCCINSPPSQTVGSTPRTGHPPSIVCILHRLELPATHASYCHPYRHTHIVVIGTRYILHLHTYRRLRLLLAGQPIADAVPAQIPSQLHHGTYEPPPRSLPSRLSAKPLFLLRTVPVFVHNVQALSPGLRFSPQRSKLAVPPGRLTVIALAAPTNNAHELANQSQRHHTQQKLEACETNDADRHRRAGRNRRAKQDTGDDDSHKDISAVVEGYIEAGSGRLFGR